MVNNIINGISVKLDSIFGDGYEIYTENVEQGLNEPCFSIQTLKASNKPLLGRRKQRTYPFDIVYFPEEGNEEMLKVSEQLLECLEYITLLNGDVLRGHSLEAEIVDDVLHVFVSYIVFLNDTSKDDPMESLESDVVTKG